MTLLLLLKSPPVTGIATYLTPVSNVSNTNWTYTSGTSAFALLQEDPATVDQTTDVSYMQSGAAGTFEVGLSGTNGATSLSAATLRVRADNTDLGSSTLNISLIQGSTTIVTQANTIAANPSSPAGSLFTIVLTGPQLAAITNPDDLRVRFNVSSVASGGQWRVFSTRLSITGVAAADLAYFDSPNWFDATAGASARTVVASWAADDDVYVIGLTGANNRTFTTPTATGLTFAPVTSFTGGAAGTDNVYIWRARAAAAGTAVTITATSSGGPSGIAALAVSGSAGVGTIATPSGGAGSTSTISLTRSREGSRVLFAAADDTVTASTHTWTPAGYTERVANDNGVNYGAYIATWPGQGLPGTTSYGQTLPGTDWTKLAIEILPQYVGWGIPL